ncbi:fatty acyl-AMP ligase [[Mycobacterium] crassicus]|uniref:Fatty acyl-AMP ligase n=1 Tax=[Mycobacterium] crassicus TaxID=2872309 RepID=A0ABU5XCC3_9MYCO|nr:fatty acyl-AMP ligase [Mycolicibacter sp. MYC098]MEB3019768.1 fatty acyl-AMP ligase [Mycolicibacter sp. MYC098]
MRVSTPTLVELLRRQAERYGDKVVFSFSYNGDEEDRSELTYRELDTRARAIGSTLQQQGAAGQRVLVLVRPGLDFIAGYFGCLYAGAVAVPVHQKMAPRLAVVIPDAQAGFALSTADTQANIKAGVDALVEGRALRWCVIEDAVTADPDSWVAPAVDPGSTAMIQYTSGSTTSPKGVVLSHGNLMHNLEVTRRAWNGDDSGVGVYWLPPHHDMGLIGVILEIMYAGASAVLMSPAAFIKRPMRWLEAVSRHRAYITTAPSFAYDKCVERSTPAERAALDLSGLSIAMIGAEPVRASTLAAFADAFAPAGFRLEAFTPVYGLAEATLLVSGQADSAAPGVRHLDRDALGEHRAVDVAPDDPSAAAVVGCGPPQDGQRVVIVDPVTRQSCGTDEIGEIWVAGPSVAQGYWGRPEETAQTFAGYVADTGEGPFLRTGDLGFLCAGELFVTGRVQDLVSIDGHNYYPNDVEATVQDSHPMLLSGRGAVMATTPVQGAIEQLVVVQEVDPAATELDGVIDTVRAAITRYHGIEASAVVLVAPLSIPTTSSGKIQRSQCRRQFIDGDLAVLAEWRGPLPEPPPPASQDEVNQIMAELQASLLRKGSSR